MMFLVIYLFRREPQVPELEKVERHMTEPSVMYLPNKKYL